MSGVVPIGSMDEARLVSRDEEYDRVDHAHRPSDVLPDATVKSESHKQDQQKTIHGFQYTGKGSFIDKVF